MIRQCDVVQVQYGKRRLLALVLQSDTTNHSPTVIVAPVRQEPRSRFIARLNIPVEIDGKAMAVIVDELAAVPRAAIMPTNMNLAHLRTDFMSAIDLLFAGI